MPDKSSDLEVGQNRKGQSHFANGTKPPNLKTGQKRRFRKRGKIGGFVLHAEYSEIE